MINEFMRRMGARIARVLRAVQEEHRQEDGRDVTLFAVCVDRDGRVFIFEPVGDGTVRQVEAIASAFMRTAAYMRDPESEIRPGRQAPSVLSPVVGNILRHALGSSADFVAVYAEGPCEDGGNIATVLADVNGRPAAHLMRSLARASASLAIATNVDRPHGDCTVAVPEHTTTDILARGSRVLAMHAEASARSAAEAQVNAGIPFVRRVGAVEEES